jgi:hypothetical protein
MRHPPDAMAIDQHVRTATAQTHLKNCPVTGGGMQPPGMTRIL